MASSEHDINATFWEHLDALRSVIIHIVLAVVIGAIVAFCFKDQLFGFVFAPKYDTFITYRLFKKISDWVGLSSMAPGSFKVDLINTAMASQFLVHVKVAFYASLILVSPYILYSIFSFVSPALYKNERRFSVRFIFGGYIMFMMGAALCYLLIFPFTFRFLGMYQVSPDVQNFINLDSYIDTMMLLILMMGAVFELPILCWLLAKIGLLKASAMKAYRKHAIVVIVIVAAVITPTGDAFTLTIVSLPIYLLYEFSIIIVGNTRKHHRISDDDEDDDEIEEESQEKLPEKSSVTEK